MIDKRFEAIIIETAVVRDIRFRFFEGGPGSDANNPHTDYSNAYLKVTATGGAIGVGIGFALGKGNEHICLAVKELFPIIQGASLFAILSNFKVYWRKLANPFQSRWIGPNCGPYYMAAGVIANAVFDLWAKLENKPLWEAASELEPDDIISLIDFRYVEHIITPAEARELLSSSYPGRRQRRSKLETTGLPCYFTTWMGTSIPELLDQIQKVREETGIRDFKLKVGGDVETDKRRMAAVREKFGNTIRLYIDANQVWSPVQAASWVEQLAQFGPVWIEEPTAPDCIDGHRYVRERVERLGVHVVTGENCPNSHVAAQLICSKAVDRFQIDACRVIGPPENFLIMLVAAKYGIPICPHAGGSGLDELVPHLAAWNYIVCGTSLDDVLVEQIKFCSKYFASPSVIKNGHVMLPSTPGYIVGMLDEAIEKYEYPEGTLWRIPNG